MAPPPTPLFPVKTMRSQMGDVTITFRILCNYYRMQTEDLQMAVFTVIK